jgi:hypothetical protein
LKWEICIGHDKYSKQALILFVGRRIGVVEDKKQ